MDLSCLKRIGQTHRSVAPSAHRLPQSIEANETPLSASAESTRPRLTPPPRDVCVQTEQSLEKSNRADCIGVEAKKIVMDSDEGTCCTAGRKRESRGGFSLFCFLQPKRS